MSEPSTMNPSVRELPSDFRLGHGSHADWERGACLMEAVAWVAGEPHSDHPACASPVLSSLGRWFNDRFTDDERELLAPLIPRLVGTRAPELVDAVIREIAPMGLCAVKWTDLADRMRAIAPIVDMASAQSALAICREIRSESSGRRSSAAAAYAAAASSSAADAAAAAAAADAAYAAAAAASSSAAAAAVAAADDAACAYAAAAACAYAAAVVASAASSDAAYAASASDLSPEERVRGDLALARRPIVEATVRAYERAIAIVA